MRDDAELACWALGDDRADLAAVEEVARLALAARRLGCSIRLRHAGPALSELLDLVGLADVVGLAGDLGQAGREAERGEQAGVEEVVVPDDPVA